jgi:predicted glycoside hydrolase/deacetylase ChbG (UPF0249 family)
MSQKKPTYIISADDFGLSYRANRNILSLLMDKKIDRVSLMIDGVFSANDLANLKKNAPKIDLHLEIIPEKKPRKKIPQGTFWRGIRFAAKLFSRDMHPQSVQANWERQIQSFYTLFGTYPDGLTSHEHTHYFPTYFKIILSLAQKNHISFIRFGKKSIFFSPTITCYVVSFFHYLNKKRFLQSKLSSSDYLISLDWIRNFSAFFSQAKTGSLEIVCHPEIKEEMETIRKYF